jgi:hypothetical protein
VIYVVPLTYKKQLAIDGDRAAYREAFARPTYVRED